MLAIKTENLTKYYGKARGIIDVSLEVGEGAVMGFIGPNGAGKSTTIRTLLGLISPTGGGAKVLGMDIIKEKTKLLADIGYLPPETAFYSGMRVGDILDFSARLHKKDCSKEAKRLCERLDLDVRRRADELSLGNKKKVGIVCALQHRPRLYILDEPTSGLDPLIQSRFFELLSERNAEGATIMLSSHVLSEVAKHCTHAAIIREGRLLASGRLDEIANAGGKLVTLKGIGGKARETVEKIENARDILFDEGSNSLCFTYTGSPKALIAALSGLEFEDVSIREQDLDSVFMRYYNKEGN